MSKSRLLGWLACGVVFLSGCGGSGGSHSLPNPGPNELRIGGLLSLTGNWNTLGKASKAAMELARDDVNAYFSGQGIATRVSLDIKDTKLDPNLAFSSFNTEISQGVKAVIGPQSSSEVAAVKSIADSYSVPLISQGSTASSLSIADDYVFRMVPDDVREARALVALAQADGIQAMVPVARNDAGNGGLYDSVRARFSDAGGQLSAGVRYEANATDFTATLSAIHDQVVALKGTHSDAQIGVYLAGFDEVAQILALAQNDAVLSAVHWYGSDGVVGSTALTSNSGAAAFMTQHGFPSPIFGLDPGMVGTWAPVARRIKLRSGVDPDAFALSAYDAVWLAALAYQNGGSVDQGALRTALVQTAATYTGITGPTKFDAAGDRESGNFDFWSVSGTTWKRVAIYKASDGSITRTP